MKIYEAHDRLLLKYALHMYRPTYRGFFSEIYVRMRWTRWFYFFFQKDDFARNVQRNILKSGKN